MKPSFVLPCLRENNVYRQEQSEGGRRPRQHVPFRAQTAAVLMRFRHIAIGFVAVTLLGALVPAPARAEVRGIVAITYYYDGDTYRETTGERIRLACIDTPELRGKERIRSQLPPPVITFAGWCSAKP